MHRGTVTLLALAQLVAVAVRGQGPTPVRLSSDLFRGGRTVVLDEGWRYRSEDGPGWDDPSLEDESWDLAPSTTYLEASPEIVWFRLHLDVDESLWGRNLGLELDLRGAAELHLNGQLLYRFGSVDVLPQGARADAGSRLRTFSFPPQRHQVLALRYSTNRLQGFDWLSGQSGFELTLGNVQTMIQRHNANQRFAARQQMFFVGVLASQTLLHLLLFVFYPRLRSNLYFAVTTALSAVLVALQFERILADDQALYRLVFRLWSPALFIAWIAMMRFAYSLYHPRLPRRFWLFFGVAAVLVIVTWFSPNTDAFTRFWWFHLASLGETLHVSIRAIQKKLPAAWIISFGFGVFTLSIAYQLLIEARLLPPPGELVPVAYYGLCAVLLATSIYLARTFARTHHDLEARLAQVQELSARTLEQELEAKDRELERRLLEADNRRKTEELEEARRFQLSLLPASVPVLPNLRIAVSMETATEVGGDYYDFHVSESGVLTVALGDATGHGAKAGTMVSVMKGLFSVFAQDPDLGHFFHQSSGIVRRMNAGSMQMAMAIARVEDHTLTYAAAGMPPVLIYRARDRRVEEVLVEGMPLGGIPRFPYQQTNVSLASGDTILLMSDGFPELLNPAREPLSYVRAQGFFEEVADGEPEEVVSHLSAAARGWCGGVPGDDVTFVVLKVA